MNIIFKTPQGIAVTELGEANNSRAHARFLLGLNGFEEWEPVAYDVPPEFFPAWPFHEDWRWVGKEITVNLDSARLSTAGRLRCEREPLFAELDKQFMLALEKGADTSGIIAKKDELRKVTDKVALCYTLDELANLHAVL